MTDAAELAQADRRRPHVHVADADPPVRRRRWSPPPARSPDLRLGASPRATLHLLRAAKAAAALDDRDYVLPDDVQALAVPVLAHRLLPTAEAQIARRRRRQVVADIVARVPVPTSARGTGPSRCARPCAA